MSANLMRRKLLFEGLESRRVLAAGVVLSEGVLTVEGSNKNDWVFVSLSGELGDVLTVQFNKTTHEFSLAEVSELHIHGNNGNDRLWVSDDVKVNAFLDGGKGNDWIWSGGGNDHVVGGAGNDRLHGGSGDDVVEDAAGNNRLSGGAGNDQLHGGSGHDKLFGGEGDDLLWGGSKKDHLHGDAGNDQLFGEGDKDHLLGGDGDDQLFGGDGKDHVYGNAGNDWLEGGADHDKLWGGAGDDSLKGNAGNDHLNGGDGVNLLDGDEGRNHLTGGTEYDFENPPPPPEPTWVEYTTYIQSEGGCFTSLVYTYDGSVERLTVEVGSSLLFSSLDLVIGGVLWGTVNVVDGSGQLVFSTSPGDGELGFVGALVEGAAVDVGPELHGFLNLSQV